MMGFGIAFMNIKYSNIKKDVVGKTYGMLTVTEDCDTSPRRVNVFCSCGNTKNSVLLTHLRSGKIVSCGCYRMARVKEVNSVKNTKHGMYGTKTYKAWSSMRDRVNDKENKDYGGRGITCSKEWLQFENFLKDMGEVPRGFSLDRIDVNGNYCKENCRWVDRSLQAFNKRTSTRNSSGKVGVELEKKTGKYRASISKDCVTYYLGTYLDFETACRVREMSEIYLYGENID